MAQYSSLSDIPAILNTWKNNFTRNTSEAFTRLTPKDAIRLVIIGCAYLLIVRPLLVRLGTRIQAKQHEDANKEADAQALSGKVSIPGVDSDSDEDEDEDEGGKVGQWGRTARLRQRRVVRRALEMKERAALEDESDEEIREFLERE